MGRSNTLLATLGSKHMPIIVDSDSDSDMDSVEIQRVSKPLGHLVSNHRAASKVPASSGMKTAVRVPRLEQAAQALHPSAQRTTESQENTLSTNRGVKVTGTEKPSNATCTPPPRLPITESVAFKDQVNVVQQTSTTSTSSLKRKRRDSSPSVSESSTAKHAKNTESIAFRDHANVTLQTSTVQTSSLKRQHSDPSPSISQSSSVKYAKNADSIASKDHGNVVLQTSTTQTISVKRPRSDPSPSVSDSSPAKHAINTGDSEPLVSVTDIAARALEAEHALLTAEASHNSPKPDEKGQGPRLADLPAQRKKRLDKRGRARQKRKAEKAALLEAEKAALLASGSGSVNAPPNAPPKAPLLKAILKAIPSKVKPLKAATSNAPQPGGPAPVNEAMIPFPYFPGPQAFPFGPFNNSFVNFPNMQPWAPPPPPWPFSGKVRPSMGPVQLSNGIAQPPFVSVQPPNGIAQPPVGLAKPSIGPVQQSNSSSATQAIKPSRPIALPPRPKRLESGSSPRTPVLLSPAHGASTSTGCRKESIVGARDLDPNSSLVEDYHSSPPPDVVRKETKDLSGVLSNTQQQSVFAEVLHVSVPSADPRSSEQLPSNSIPQEHGLSSETVLSSTRKVQSSTTQKFQANATQSSSLDEADRFLSEIMPTILKLKPDMAQSATGNQQPGVPDTTLSKRPEMSLEQTQSKRSQALDFLGEASCLSESSLEPATIASKQTTLERYIAENKNALGRLEAAASLTEKTGFKKEIAQRNKLIRTLTNEIKTHYAAMHAATRVALGRSQLNWKWPSTQFPLMISLEDI